MTTLQTPKDLVRRGAPFREIQTIEECALEVCVAVIVACALLAALVESPDPMIPQPWATFSTVSGWAYFAAWSLSFYPQVYSNWKRKSVIGLSFDFAYTNVLGFFCLSVYYSAFYFNSSVRADYREQHHGSDNSVRANDVFFALHALAVTSFTVIQTFMYEKGNQRTSIVCRSFLTISVGVILSFAIALVFLPDSSSSLTFLYMLSYIKVIVTVSKYIPQALLNRKRKSTVGFSIGQVLLDLTGGILSLFQLILEASVLQDLSLITGDPVKLLLALLSLVYDSLLMTQHYVLYPLRGDDTGQSSNSFDQENLLNRQNEPIQEDRIV